MLCGDSNEEWSPAPPQVISASAILRFQTLAWLTSVLLDEEVQRLLVAGPGPMTRGQARREIQRHRLLAWLHGQFLSGVHPAMVFAA